MANSVAVLTGDIIASSRNASAKLDDAMKTLSEAAAKFERWGAEHLAPRFTRFRGDGWHLVIADPSRALRGALYLRARLRAADLELETRISVGIGSVDSLGTIDLSDATGTAFLASGHGLDRMGRSHTMAIDGEGITAKDCAIVILAAERSRRWSREQAEAIALALEGNTTTQAEIADHLSISTQAVNLRLTSGGYQALRETIEIWENPQLWQRQRGLRNA